MLKKLSVLGMGLVVALSITGCGGGESQTVAEEDPEPVVESTVQADDEDAYPVIGEDVAGAIKVVTKNNLGEDITSISTGGASRRIRFSHLDVGIGPDLQKWRNCIAVLRSRRGKDHFRHEHPHGFRLLHSSGFGTGRL